MNHFINSQQNDESFPLRVTRGATLESVLAPASFLGFCSKAKGWGPKPSPALGLQPCPLKRSHWLMRQAGKFPSAGGLRYRCTQNIPVTLERWVCRCLIQESLLKAPGESALTLGAGNTPWKLALGDSPLELCSDVPEQQGHPELLPSEGGRLQESWGRGSRERATSCVRGKG